MPAHNNSFFPSVLASATALRDAARSTRSNSFASQQRSDAASIAGSSVWSVDVDAPEMPKLLTSQNFTRQGAQRSPLVVHVEPPIQSAHASIKRTSVPASEPEVFEPQSPVEFEQQSPVEFEHQSPVEFDHQFPVDFEHPGPAPPPPSRPSVHNEPIRGPRPFNVRAYDAVIEIPVVRHTQPSANDRPDVPRRLGTSLRQGLKRIETLVRGPSKAAKYGVRLVPDTFAGREPSPTLSLQEARAKQAAELKAYLKANPTADADRRYPNALPPRRRPARDPVSPDAALIAEATPARRRRVKRLSGDARRMTTFGAFIDAGARSDTSSESSREAQARQDPNVAADEDEDELYRLSEPRVRRDRASWQTADILLVQNPPAPIDENVARYMAEPKPVVPSSVVPPQPHRIRRKPVPQRTTVTNKPDLNKPLPPSPPPPRAPRNTAYYGGIPAEEAEAFGCDEDGNARTWASPEDFNEAAHKIRSMRKAGTISPANSDDSKDSNPRPKQSSGKSRAKPAPHHRRRRSSDDGINESIESQVRRMNLDPEAEAIGIAEAYRLQDQLLNRPKSTSSYSKNGDVTIDHLVRGSHVSVLVTKQTDAKSIESFRSQIPLEDYTNENNDEAAALNARLAQERMGLSVSKRHRTAGSQADEDHGDSIK
ncbi:hypothetical protein LTR35_009015 [Friedmanniomyces endolithicus]|uniref:Uncharacterized protein n=1 Tax=Friedmanniomyces endolithicus TaxID=329885 RepID=A0AAN6JEH6_9PEZI|nr:hypothetical protein LTR35_009015 [Friedmanniomyces endolithicus]KAK0295416.1 hypothetical protein LTS00_006047 [Friedmanniomyces endolithicus]KAK0327177.1 hypothetical protein LTR82_001939 [Friedmanniomyces endolithicus]KAK1016521.1 hypothetical protein LTR54_003199 [Friedmanniomyces endolithicus]